MNYRPLEVVVAPWATKALRLIVVGFAVNLAFAKEPTIEPVRTLSIALEEASPVKSIEAANGVHALDNLTDAAAVLRPNLPLLRQVLLLPEDLRSAVLVFDQNRKPLGGSSGRIEFYRMLRAVSGLTIQAGVDFDPVPIARYSYPAGLETSQKTEDWEPILSRFLRGEWSDYGILERATASPRGDAGNKNDESKNIAVRPPSLRITFVAHPARQLFPLDIRSAPRTGIYVKINQGHLTYDGQRLRLWGAGGHADRPNESESLDPFPIDINVARLRKMGFNAFRLWGPVCSVDSGSAKKGELVAETRGDDSGFDRYDRFVAACKQEGLFLWITAPHYYPFNFEPHKGKPGANRNALLEDDSFLAPGQDWQGWKHAVLETNFDLTRTKFFDERLQRLYLRHLIAFLNHVNPYTGRRYAEEEAVAILSLDNENTGPQDLLRDGVASMPGYFRKEILAGWNAWLTAKYGNEPGLRAAYGGQLDPGEGLGHVEFKPLFNQRNSYPEARAGDLVQFVLQSASSFYDGLRSAARAQAPSGVGSNVIPIVYNTWYTPNRAWLESATKSGISSPSYYSYTLRSLLTEPPNEYILDTSSSIEGIPTVIYEANAGRPNPFRAEFPLRLAALALSIG